jgi:hypothetical protein
MHAMLLRRQLKIDVPEGSAALPLAVLATFQKNLESLGFSMSPALADRVATLDVAQAESLHRRLLKQLTALVGAQHLLNPMYPGFPMQVMRLSEAELYWNAQLHYWGVQDQVGVKSPREPLRERPKTRVIDLGTFDDVKAIFAALVRSKSPYSQQDREDVAAFMSQHRDHVARLMPETIPSKENLAVIVAACLRTPCISEARLDGMVRTATDVLRIAVALFDGDVSLAESTKFGSIPRAVRRRLLGWIEQAPNRLEDMQRWSGRWIRLGERLHPGESAERFPQTAADFAALRAGRRAESFNSRIEAALEQRDHPCAVTLLRERPGEFARRLDVLSRGDTDAEATIDAFAACADAVSTPVLLQAMTHFRHRHRPRDLRVFFPKGQVAKLFAVHDRVPPLRPECATRIVEICESALLRRFSALAPLGTCYLDPALSRYLVPFSQRSAAKSLRTIVRGSCLPLPECGTLRFFLWWRNGKSRVDVDLSAVMYSSDFRYIDTLAYYNLRNFGAHHSGDIVDAPDGASEFIDVELERCAARGVRYIVMCLNNYTNQPYCDLPECYAGWMARTAPNSGEVYEPSTVIDRFDVASNTIFCLPAMFDIQAREVIWSDIALASEPRYVNNVHNNLGGVSLMLRALTSLRKTNLHELFDLHVRARGIRTDEMTQADTVFSVETGLRPTDLEKIAAEFM